MKRIKVADASGSRRAEERLVIKRKDGAFKQFEPVMVCFDDEYVRNGCCEADEALYTVERVELAEDDDGRARGMYEITLLKLPGAKS